MIGWCAQGPLFDIQLHRKQREKPELTRDLVSTLGEEDPQPQMGLRLIPSPQQQEDPCDPMRRELGSF